MSNGRGKIKFFDGDPCEKLEDLSVVGTKRKCFGDTMKESYNMSHSVSYYKEGSD